MWRCNAARRIVDRRATGWLERRERFGAMIERYPLTWPAAWKRTPYSQRVRGRFSRQPITVRNMVMDEVRLLGGSTAIISSNVAVRLDGLPYVSQSAVSDSGVAVYFSYRGKPMVFARDRYVNVWANLQAIAMTIAALRGIKRWGASDMMEKAFTGFGALPEPSWRRTLGLDQESSVSIDQVESAFRRLCHDAHPDVGGSDARFREIEEARRQAREELGA